MRAFACAYCGGPVLSTDTDWSCADCGSEMLLRQPVEEEDIQREAVYAQYSVEFGTKSRTSRLIEMINAQEPGEKGQLDTASRVEALKGSISLKEKFPKGKKGKKGNKSAAPKLLSWEELLEVEAKHVARIRKLEKVKTSLADLTAQQATNEVSAALLQLTWASRESAASSLLLHCCS